MKTLYAYLTLLVIPSFVFANNNEAVQNYYKGEYAKASAELQKNADNKDKQSAFLLGKMYMYGFGVEKNSQKGIDLITQAAKSGKEDAQMYLAKYYLSQKNNFNESLKWFKEAAKSGNVDAQMFCATAYLYGKGVKQNKETARKYVIDAAKNGNAVAQYELAKIFLNSRYKKDRALGLLWLKKSAEAKNPNAQYILGTKMFSGDGVDKNRSQAINLFKSAADGGNSEAGIELGKYFLSLPRNHRNFKEALYWYEKSAELGNADAQNRLGELYLTSWEDFSNPKKALHWLAAAAKQGDKEAQFKLAKMYATGSLVPKDEQKAFQWRLKLAEKGDANAQREIGMMYYLGTGVPENKGLAISWLKKAAANDDYIAKYKLESIEKEWNNKKKINQALIDTPKLASLNKNLLFNPNFKLADPNTIPIEQVIKVMGKIEYAKKKPELIIPKPKLVVDLKTASKQTLTEIKRQAIHGFPQAQFLIGSQYQMGIGVKQDLSIAKDWYEKSAKQNYLKADYALALLYLEGEGVDKNYQKAEHWLKTAALKGDEDAQFLLGQIYEFGLGNKTDKNYISKNLAASKAMYGLAATSSVPQAQYNLAQLYISGLLDETHHRDEQSRYHKLAYELFSQAAKANMPEAELALAYYHVANPKNERQLGFAFNAAKNNSSAKAKFLLALMSSRGIGMNKNQQNALEYLKASAANGNTMAKFFLGSYYAIHADSGMDKVKAQEYLIDASEKDIPFASYNLAILDYRQGNLGGFLSLLEKARNARYQPASILLADYYLASNGTESELKEASQIYTRLAEQGNITAQVKLAYLYQNGIYFSKNYQKAYHWYQLAAQKNNTLAEYVLGNMYQIGQGTTRDLAKAKHWYQQAAKENFVPAQVALGFVNEVDMHNYQRALYWYEKAARHNDPVALYNLGLLYEYGKGIPVNEAKAKTLFEKARQALHVKS